jgi:hypothetical protein
VNGAFDLACNAPVAASSDSSPLGRWLTPLINLARSNNFPSFGKEDGVSKLVCPKSLDPLYGEANAHYVIATRINQETGGKYRIHDDSERCMGQRKSRYGPWMDLPSRDRKVGRPRP